MGGGQAKTNNMERWKKMLGTTIGGKLLGDGEIKPAAKIYYPKKKPGGPEVRTGTVLDDGTVLDVGGNVWTDVVEFALGSPAAAYPQDQQERKLAIPKRRSIWFENPGLEPDAPPDLNSQKTVFPIAKKEGGGAGNAPIG